MKKLLAMITMAILIFASCSVRDLRTPFAIENKTQLETNKGKKLLEETYLAMGYDNLEAVKTFEAKSLFEWTKPWTYMPMNALPGNKGKEVEFKFATGTFDGSVKYLEGKYAGNTYGLQSWETYNFSGDQQASKAKDERRKWALATYHYVIEAPMRIRDAEIIRYAGEKVLEGKTYDLVFVTWGKDEPHKEHDQYIVYINRETKMTDLMEIIINDFFLPLPAGMKNGTIRTERKKTSIGTYLPADIYIQLGQPKPIEKYVYKFNLSDYQFDSFSEDEIYPLQGVKKVGDAKEIL